MEIDKEWKYLLDFIQNLVGLNYFEYFIGFLNEIGSWWWLSDVIIEVFSQKWCWYNYQLLGDGYCVVMYKNYVVGNNFKVKRMKGYFNDLFCNLFGLKGINRGFICEKIVGKESWLYYFNL